MLVEERVKHGPPAVPAVRSVPVSFSSVSKVLVTAPKGLTVSEVMPTTQLPLLSLADIPAYWASGSTSRRYEYNWLLQFVRSHPFILGVHWSQEFTFGVQGDLLTCLQCMSPDDPSELVRISRAYYDRNRKADADVFGGLEQFCKHYPCVLSGREYCDTMSWTSSVKRKLRHILDNIHDGDLRQRPLYVQAQNFLDTVPLFLPSS